MEGKLDVVTEEQGISENSLDAFFENRSTIIVTTIQRNELKDKILQTKYGKKIAMFERLKIGGITVENSIDKYLENYAQLDQKTNEIVFNPEEFTEIFYVEKAKASKELGLQDIPDKLDERLIKVIMNNAEMASYIKEYNEGGISIEDVVKKIETVIINKDVQIDKNYDDIFGFNVQYSKDPIVSDVMDKFNEVLNNNLEYSNKIFGAIKDVDLKNKDNNIGVNDEEISKDVLEINKKIYEKAQGYKTSEIKKQVYIKAKEYKAMQDKDSKEAMEVLLEIKESLNQLGYGYKINNEECENDPSKIIEKYDEIIQDIKNIYLKREIGEFQTEFIDAKIPIYDSKKFAKMLLLIKDNSPEEQKAFLYNLINSNKFQAYETEIDYSFIKKDGNHFVIDADKRKKIIDSKLNKEERRQINNEVYLSQDEIDAKKSIQDMFGEIKSRREQNLDKTLINHGITFEKENLNQNIEDFLVLYSMVRMSEEEKGKDVDFASGGSIKNHFLNEEIELQYKDAKSLSGAMTKFMIQHTEIFKDYISVDGKINIEAINNFMEEFAQNKDKKVNTNVKDSFEEMLYKDEKVKKAEFKNSKNLSILKKLLNSNEKNKIINNRNRNNKDKIFETLKDIPYEALSSEMVEKLQILDIDRFKNTYSEKEMSYIPKDDSIFKISKSIGRNIGRFIQDVPKMLTDPKLFKKDMNKVLLKFARGAQRLKIIASKKVGKLLNAGEEKKLLDAPQKDMNGNERINLEQRNFNESLVVRNAPRIDSYTFHVRGEKKESMPKKVIDNSAVTLEKEEEMTL